MGIFSFGKKDDTPGRRLERGADAGSGRKPQNARVERRSRRPERGADAEAMLLDPTLPEKQRARRRLVGAVALVIAAIVILPMVLDSHPKPVTGDIAIDIPNRPANVPKTAPQDTQAGVAPDNPALPDVAPGASGLAAAAVTAPDAGNAPAPQAQAQTPAQPHAAAPSAAARVAPSPNIAATPRPSAPAADSGTPAAPAGARFAVQLGSFPDDASANSWIAKLKAAGVPAYIEHRKQPDGTTRSLLRAGPFADRNAAAAAVAKVRGAGLTAASSGAE